MKVQRISNTRQQNFGKVIVLENGIAVSQQKLDDWVAVSPYTRIWAEISGKERLFVCNGSEQAELAPLVQAASLVVKKNKVPILARISARVKVLAQNVEPIVVNSIDDLNIKGFEELAGIKSLTHLLRNLASV